MSKLTICECDGPHKIKPGTKVRVEGDDKEYTVANMCTRGTGRDYTKLAYFLIDPDMVDGKAWPGTFVHHSKIIESSPDASRSAESAAGFANLDSLTMRRQPMSEPVTAEMLEAVVLVTNGAVGHHTADLILRAARSVDPLVAENEQLRQRIDQMELADIAYRNPGIDMDEVKRFRAGLEAR